ncbi:hypothetical protein GEMRC1_007000 [Eukaryota sp. GEM-RC1]
MDRCEHLKTIASWFHFFVKSSTTPSHAFLAGFKEFSGALKVALSDLRSALVKEACVLVSLAAMTLNQNFVVFFESLLSTLLSISFVTVAIIQNAADQTMRSCLLHSSISPRVIAGLCDSTTSKQATLRMKVAKFLSIILAIHPPPSLSKYEDQLSGAVTCFLTDSQPECRQAARSTLWLLEKHFPGIADDILSAIDSHQRKAALSEKSFHTKTRTGNEFISYVYSSFVPADLMVPVSATHLGLSDRSIPVRGTVGEVEHIEVLNSSHSELKPKESIRRKPVRMQAVPRPSTSSAVEKTSSREEISDEVTLPVNQSQGHSKNLRRLSLRFSNQRQANIVEKVEKIKPIPIEKEVDHETPVAHSSPDYVENEEESQWNSPELLQSPEQSQAPNPLLSKVKTTLAPLTPKTPGRHLMNTWSGAQSSMTFDSPMVNRDHKAVFQEVITKLKGDADEKRSACASVITLVKEDVADHVWNTFFGQLLLSLIGLFEDRDSTVRELTLFCIREIARCEELSHLLVEFAEIVLVKVIQLTADPMIEVSDAADDCSEELVNCLPSNIVFPLLIPLIVSSENDSIKVTSMRLAGICVLYLGSVIEQMYSNELSLLSVAYEGKFHILMLTFERLLFFVLLTYTLLLVVGLWRTYKD